MVILGLDLSLAAAGCVAVPEDWEGDWSRVARMTVGESVPDGSPEERHVGRLHRISSEIVAFAQRHHCTNAVLEGYAFGSEFGRERLGEVGGVVKIALLTRAGVRIEEPIPPKSGRKLMLGTGRPAGDPKKACRVFLQAREMPLGFTDDEVDAFVIANTALVKIGAAAFQSPPAVKVRARRRAA